MKIIRAYPPNFSDIAKAFPFIKGRPGILFAWGDRIYNPSGVTIDYPLMRHEETHGLRQQSCKVTAYCGPEQVAVWWGAYLSDPKFRLDEELAAHRTEFEAYKSRMPNERDQEMYLTLLSQRLSSKLYGSLITEFEAKRRIQGENSG